MAGTVFLLGGMNDTGFVPAGWVRGLRAAGLPHRLEVVNWQQPLWWSAPCLANLWRVSHHRWAAAALAARVRAAEPPVHVIAHSAGTAVTAYALSLLGETERVRSAVLVGSGLSPGFDLTPVLDRCEAGVLSVECGTDLFFLGLGTSVFGTCDRRWGPAAGLVGFRGQDQRLHRLRWAPRHARTGWLGGHLFVAAPGFARTVLADWVRAAETHPTPV